MSRYQLLDTKTGEIIWPRNTKQTASAKHARALWAVEDKRRGRPVRKTYRQRKASHPIGWQELATAVVLAVFVLAYFYIT